MPVCLTAYLNLYLRVLPQCLLVSSQLRSQKCLDAFRGGVVSVSDACSSRLSGATRSVWTHCPEEAPAGGRPRRAAVLDRPSSR